MKDSDGTLFCRKEFVLALANQEGGAHVDPQIKAAYDKLANSNSMGWTYKEGDSPEIPLSNPVPFAVRQISYEAVESVRQQRDRIEVSRVRFNAAPTPRSLGVRSDEAAGTSECWQERLPCGGLELWSPHIRVRLGSFWHR